MNIDRKSIVVFVVMILIFFIYFLNYKFIGSQAWQMDFWEHAAAIKSLSDNYFSPLNPIVGLEIPHVFFTPYHLFLAFLSNSLAISNIKILAIISYFNLSLLLLAFYKLYTFFEDKRDRTHEGLLIFLLLNLFLWSKPWVWSSFINFKSLFYVLSYPSTFALSLSVLLFCFWKSTHAFIIGILTAMVLLIHPLSCIFLITLLFSTYIATKNINIVKVFIVILIALLGVYFWPYYNLLDLVFDSDIDNYQVHLDSKVLYGVNIFRLLPLIILSPLIYVSIKKEKIILIFSVISTIIYLGAYLFRIYAFGRIISYLAIVLFLLLAKSITLDLIKKNYLISFLVLCSIIPNLTDSVGMVKSNFSESENLKRVADFDLIKATIPASSLVLSSESYINYLPALGIYVTYSVFPPYWIQGNSQRKEFSNRFLNRSNPAEKRKIINNYCIDYILVDRNVDLDLPFTTEYVTSNQRISIYRTFLDND